MKDILTAPFMTEMIRTATNMYNHGWDERNGGNISLLLDEAEVREHLVFLTIVRTIPTGFAAPELDGKIFLVTGTGKYFKNVQYDPAANLGIVRLAESGHLGHIGILFHDPAAGETVGFRSKSFPVEGDQAVFLFQHINLPFDEFQLGK